MSIHWNGETCSDTKEQVSFLSSTPMHAWC